jgi:hypothetical protein
MQNQIQFVNGGGIFHTPPLAAQPQDGGLNA